MYSLWLVKTHLIFGFELSSLSSIHTNLRQLLSDTFSFLVLLMPLMFVFKILGRRLLGLKTYFRYPNQSSNVQNIDTRFTHVHNSDFWVNTSHQRYYNQLYHTEHSILSEYPRYFYHITRLGFGVLIVLIKYISCHLSHCEPPRFSHCQLFPWNDFQIRRTFG